MKQIEGFALKTNNDEFLIMEQVSNGVIEVYATDYVDHATLFGSLEIALQEMDNIRHSKGKWTYLILSENMPVKIVKVTKTIYVEDVCIKEANHE
jgi:hypothetical protein